jgi:hypothetical protein
MTMHERKQAIVTIMELDFQCGSEDRACIG